MKCLRTLARSTNTGGDATSLVARIVGLSTVCSLALAAQQLGPAHAAVRSGDSVAVVAALSAGGSVDERDGTSATPLHRAAWKGYKPIVQLLVARGATIDAVDSVGQTPLNLAVMFKNDAIVNLLLDVGANPNVFSRADNLSPYLRAIIQGSTGMAVAMQKHGGALGPKAKAFVDAAARLYPTTVGQTYIALNEVGPGFGMPKQTETASTAGRQAASQMKDTSEPIPPSGLPNVVLKMLFCDQSGGAIDARVPDDYDLADPVRVKPIADYTRAVLDSRCKKPTDGSYNKIYVNFLSARELTVFCKFFGNGPTDCPLDDNRPAKDKARAIAHQAASAAAAKQAADTKAAFERRIQAIVEKYGPFTRARVDGISDNPFPWVGKQVAFCAGASRAASPTEWLLLSGFTSAYLTSVPAGRFDHPSNSVFFIARVVGRTAGGLLQLRYVVAVDQSSPDCRDYNG